VRSNEQALLEELMQWPPAERIELVHNLWDRPGECPSLKADLLNLTSEERIELAMDLWGSIAPEDMPPPSPEQIAELERRHAELVRDPSSGSPWEEVRARLWSRYG
jgi:putative addiction module component (TIGR02574 family)